MYFRRRALCLITTIVLTSLLGCQSPSTPFGRGTESSSTPAHPLATPSPISGTLPNCLGVVPSAGQPGFAMNADGPHPSLGWAKDGDLAVSGEVVAILPPRIATPGCRWSDPPLAENGESPIITSVVVALDGKVTVVRAGIDAPRDTLVIATQGGKVGSASVEIWGDPVINVPRTFWRGEKVLVVLSKRPDIRRGTQVISTEAGPAAWDTILAFTVYADGTASGAGGSWEVDDLTARIKTALSGE